jgi:anti-anti-sigma factor
MLLLDDFNASPGFHVAVDVTAEPPRVVVAGDLDLVTCAAFRDALSDAVDAGSSEIVVDFRRLTFLGSTGIRELVRALESVERVEIHGLVPIVRRALVTAGLGGDLVIVDD